MDRRDQRRARGTYRGMVTDRGQDGCNIVTVQVLVPARLRTQPPPFRSASRRPVSRARHRPLRHPSVARLASAIAFAGAAIIDDPDQRAGMTRSSQRLRLSLTEHSLSYLYKAMPGFASNSYPLSPFYKWSWFSKVGNGPFRLPDSWSGAPADGAQLGHHPTLPLSGHAFGIVERLPSATEVAPAR